MSLCSISLKVYYALLWTSEVLQDLLCYTVYLFDSAFLSHIIMENKNMASDKHFSEVVRGFWYFWFVGWCLLLETLMARICHYSQRNHKHKISRGPLYPHCSEPTR